MTPDQQLDYLIAQVSDLTSSVTASVDRNDPEVSRKAIKDRAPRAQRLLGYMLAMEHAGVLPREVADQLSQVLEHMVTAARE